MGLKKCLFTGLFAPYTRGYPQGQLDPRQEIDGGLNPDGPAIL